MNENQFGGNIGTPGSGASGANAGGSSTTTNPTGTTGSTSLTTPTTFGTTEADETSSGGVSSTIIAMLEKFGVSESQLSSVRETLKNVNIDQSVDRAKDQVSESIGKAREYAKKNPAAVAAGLAVLVIGAGLIAAAATKKSHE